MPMPMPHQLTPMPHQLMPMPYQLMPMPHVHAQASLCANWRSELVKWLGIGGVPSAERLVHVVRTGRDPLHAEGLQPGQRGVSARPHASA